MRNLLIAEDNSQMALALVKFFMKHDYGIEHTANYPESLAAIQAREYDCYLLDLNLGKSNSLDLPKQIDKCWGKKPTLAITAVEDQSQKYTALTNGFTDYLVKPFDLEELRLRLEAQLRLFASNSTADETEQAEIVCAGFRVDLAKHQAFFKDQQLQLTKLEFNILAHLVRKADLVVSKDDLIEFAWSNYREVIDPPVRMHISNLRHKLQDFEYRIIQTIPGVGYKLNSQLD